jgi:hypothetical protein
MKSTVTFKVFFDEYISEDTTSAAFISSDNVADIYDPDNPVSSDKYNKLDSRVAKGSKVILSRKGKVKTQKRKK